MEQINISMVHYFSGKPYKINVSVIIPAYNRAYCLSRAIDSVLSQSYRDFELIVVDDGSEDSTSRLLDSYGDTVRYIKISHSGVSRARNTGIEISCGEWLAFLDSDDYWLPQKLEKQIQYLLSNHQYLICHTDEIWIKNGIRINQGKKHMKYEGWFFSPSLHLCLISPSSVMIHRRILEDVGCFDETLPFAEDYELWLRITSKYPVGYIKEKLVVKTGGHSDQLSGMIDGIEKYRLIALEKLIKSGKLNNRFLREAVDVYRKKSKIYCAGCRKRGKYEEALLHEKRLDEVIEIAKKTEAEPVKKDTRK